MRYRGKYGEDKIRDGLYYFSAISRWPIAQQAGRHDDAASNDEPKQKQKQFRTGARRTNKKRHILGALGYLLTFILLFVLQIYDQNLNGIPLQPATYQLALTSVRKHLHYLIEGFHLHMISG